MTYFLQDKKSVGAMAVIISELLPALLLALVLLIIGTPLMERFRWFAGTMLPGLLVVRFYAKKKECPQALKGAIIALFCTFIPYMFVFLKLTNTMQ